MKTTKEIAADCGLNPQQCEWLTEALSQGGLDEPVLYKDGLRELGNVIGALYRRIEALESLIEEIPEQMRPGINDMERTSKQMSLNFTWLLGMMDRVHAALCSPHVGTWQQRAERAVSVAEEDANR